MTIAYVGNFSQAHCTEVHLAATLEKLGHTVVRIQENGIDGSSLGHMINAASWDLFLFTRTWDTLVTLEHLAQLRERQIPSASYHLDLYVGLKREDGLDRDPFWKTDYVFTPDGSEQAAKVFEAKGINHVYMKPGVYEPECYRATSPNDSSEGNDVIFVGGGSPTGEEPQYGHAEWAYRGELLKYLRDTYGDRYTKYGWPQETVRNDRLNFIYARAKVVVGDSLCLNFTHPYYWSDRVYETMGRGGFIIHPYIKGMEEEFTDGQNIVYYKYGNFAQLKERIDYYLAHPKEREAIRKAGHEYVKKHCTYTQRLQQMLDTIFAAPDGQNAITDAAVAPETPAATSRISLGAGLEPESGDEWVNVDIVPLAGIDVVHNLMQYPWPFGDASANYIKAKDIIEHMATHLPDGRSSLIAFIEECHRILQPGGELFIQTPSWDADFLWIDPTHVRGYDERSFDFFDPDTDFGRATGFYSEAKFKVRTARMANGNLQFWLTKR